MNDLLEIIRIVTLVRVICHSGTVWVSFNRSDSNQRGFGSCFRRLNAFALATRGGLLKSSLGCCLIVANGLGFQAHEIVKITIFYQLRGSDLTRSRAW
ncbi:MAG TPA: hypothetical protein DDZ51_31170 [Planctomycetaceae bacterium]|nr:hypothetical protein [Planctomycetaceae bacterium]